MNQKRPKEEYQDQKFEDKGSNSDDNKKEFEIQKFKCTCGKGYILQSSLFNHIKIKHQNNKADYVVPTGIPSGRPKKSSTQNNEDNKNKKKPKDVDQNTWKAAQIYQNPFFQNLIIGFKDKMRNNFQDCKEDQENNWSNFEHKRKQMFKKIQLPAGDVKEIIKNTNTLLQAWGLLLSPQHQVDLYQLFLSHYILIFYNLPDQKKDIIQSIIQAIPDHEVASATFEEILNQNYEIKQNSEEKYEEEEEQNQDENTENQDTFVDLNTNQDVKQNEQQYQDDSNDQQQDQTQQNDQNLQNRNQEIQDNYRFDPQDLINQVIDYDENQNEEQPDKSYLAQFSLIQPSYKIINAITQSGFSLNKCESLKLSQYLNSYQQHIFEELEE
ncbi:hypothetical protein ABPG74_019408 [Tetrahymena malaccensis]